jgi:hypothetical protein
LIRLFSFLYSIDVKRLNPIELLQSVRNRFHIESACCPECKALGYLRRHDDYEHAFPVYESGEVKDFSVKIERAYCDSCHRTFAVLPDILVPNKTYNLLFILLVLQASIFRTTTTVEELCEHFGIAKTTYYRWRDEYLLHRQLEMGVLERFILKNDGYLDDPLSIFAADFLPVFFARFGFSFLQCSKTTETDSS